MAIHFSFNQANFQLGVISDTHGLLRPETLELLQGVDMIIHAGDIGPPEILETLNAIAPVTAVRGNMDGGPLGMILPEAESIQIGEVLIHVLHDLTRLQCNPSDEGIHMVINGHTHRPLLHTVKEVVYLNPGSAGPRRLGLPVSLARVNFTNGQISARHIDLDQHRLYGTETLKTGSGTSPTGRKKEVREMKFWNVMAIIVILLITRSGLAASPPVSTATQECLDCHGVFHPGIVGDWEKSRHGHTTPDQALKIEGLSNKISAAQIPNELKAHVVGCAECHTANSKAHKDTFEHNGYNVHIVVTPQDCATCHPTETKEYAGNLMANAYHNLASNELYQELEKSITGVPGIQNNTLSFAPPTAQTKAETCFFCHGTTIAVTGMETRETDAGKLKFPILSGWPNQGVGRINPDGSKGSCTACHTRHRFSMEMARKPHTCMGCHTGPDVPSYKVYSASKHGNIYASHEKEWDFKAVPWTVGKDFSAPTCAACHISLVVNTDGEPIVKRSHTMNDRLPWRIFGLIYAHPHPIDPDTSRIRNKEGLQLPTGFDGEIAAEYLIDKATQMKRQQTLQAICLSCHDSSWVSAHWRRFEHSIGQTNAVTQTATGIMQQIWKEGFATGPGKGGSPFDEAIENKWSDSWLFYANTVRFSAAMGGGGDYSVFANGYYQLSAIVREMQDWYTFRKSWRESQAAQRGISPSLNPGKSPAWKGSAQ